MGEDIHLGSPKEPQLSHIEKRRNLWYATLKVPPKLQPAIGKAKFLQSLGTDSERQAHLLAAPVVALWKAQLRKAEGEPDAVMAEALRWRKALLAAQREANAAGVEGLEAIVTGKAEELEERGNEADALRLADVALGRKTPSSLHFDEWEASIINLAQKTQDQAAKDVQRLVDHFPALEDITPQAARKWVADLQKGGTSPSSLERMMSFWRSYWRYLSAPGVDAVRAPFPFALEYIQKTKKTPEEVRAPFPADAVPKLWKAAAAPRRGRPQGDRALADLIMLGAYTGARIEELCSLKVADVNGVSFKIKDAKTPAGIREVPIHSALKPIMERLKLIPRTDTFSLA